MTDPRLEYEKEIRKKVMRSIWKNGSQDFVYKIKPNTSPLIIVTEHYSIEDLTNHVTTSGDKEKYNLILAFQNGYTITQIPLSKTLIKHFTKTFNITTPEKTNIIEFTDWCSTIKPNKHLNYAQKPGQ